jgi:thioredoxin reductase (NADPH)
MYDLIIVGSGPAGLAGALSAKRLGLFYLVLEGGSIANTIKGFPIDRLLFSTADEVELERGALRHETRPTREEVLSHYSGIALREEINIRTGEVVERVTGVDNGFVVHTTLSSYSAATVLIAIGGFGRPRKLDVPGERSNMVSYSFVDAHPYAMKQVLVVGGGNSAAEAALALADVGAKVVLSFRRPSLNSVDAAAGPAVTPNGIRSMIKPWVLEPLERAIAEGRVRIVPGSRVAEIRPGSTVLRLAASDRELEIECDHVFALIGADPDTRLLEEAGVEIAADGRPIYDADSYETNVAGLYVAGHITRDLHMKNAGPVSRRVVEQIAKRAVENRTALEISPASR